MGVGRRRFEGATSTEYFRQREKPTRRNQGMKEHDVLGMTHSGWQKLRTGRPGKVCVLRGPR